MHKTQTHNQKINKRYQTKQHKLVTQPQSKKKEEIKTIASTLTVLPGLGLDLDVGQLR